MHHIHLQLYKHTADTTVVGRTHTLIDYQTEHQKIIVVLTDTDASEISTAHMPMGGGGTKRQTGHS